MRRNRLALFLHLIWATWNRLPMIDQVSERPLYREIEDEAIGMRCTVLALNGTPDHVHIVLILPSTVTVADLAKQLKGSSSHFFNEVLQPEMPFKWQGSYGAFTVSRWDVDRIVAYVKNQKQHHADATLLPEWEETYEDVASSAGNTPPRESPRIKFGAKGRAAARSACADPICRPTGLRPDVLTRNASTQVDARPKAP